MAKLEGHSGAAYITTRRVTQEECDWLLRDFEEDEILLPFYGYTYGGVDPGTVAVNYLPEELHALNLEGHNLSVKPPYFFAFPEDAVRIVGVD